MMNDKDDKQGTNKKMRAIVLHYANATMKPRHRQHKRDSTLIVCLGQVSVCQPPASQCRCFQALPPNEELLS